MATIAKTNLRTGTEMLTNGWYERFVAEAKYNYFFLISFVILVGSCVGGITAMHILQNNAPIWQLLINIYLTMACNVACIGQASTKWVLNLFYISALANVFLLLANVL